MVSSYFIDVEEVSACQSRRLMMAQRIALARLRSPQIASPQRTILTAPASRPKSGSRGIQAT